MRVVEAAGHGLEHAALRAAVTEEVAAQQWGRRVVERRMALRLA